MRWVQVCGRVSILWHCLSLGSEWKRTFSSPVATAEFSKCAGILSAALSPHRLSGFGRPSSLDDGGISGLFSSGGPSVRFLTRYDGENSSGLDSVSPGLPTSVLNKLLYHCWKFSHLSNQTNFRLLVGIVYNLMINSRRIYVFKRWLLSSKNIFFLSLIYRFIFVFIWPWSFSPSYLTFP